MNKLRAASNRIKGAYIGISSSVMTAMMLIMPAYADQIASQINGGLKKVYSIITAIVLPIAAIALAICGFKLIFGDQRSAEAAKNAIIKIIIGIAIVYLAPFLIETVSGWFQSTNTTIW